MFGVGVSCWAIPEDTWLNAVLGEEDQSNLERDERTSVPVPRYQANRKLSDFPPSWSPDL